MSKLHYWCLEKTLPINDLGSKAIYIGKRAAVLCLVQGQVLYLIKINHGKGFRVHITMSNYTSLHTQRHMHIWVELIQG